MLTIEFIKTIQQAELPTFGSTGAAGFDVKAWEILKVYQGVKEATGEKLENLQFNFEQRGFIKMRPFERILFDTGLRLAGIKNIPEDKNVELQVRPRSGITLKEGLICQLGTVDSDYTGNIGLIVINNTPYLSTVKRGERLAQIVVNLIPSYKIKWTETVTETGRGSGGFGSTGKN